MLSLSGGWERGGTVLMTFNWTSMRKLRQRIDILYIQFIIAFHQYHVIMCNFFFKKWQFVQGKMGKDGMWGEHCLVGS